MSDSVSSIGSAGSVTATSATAPVRNDGLAEVNYYNVKTIGPNRTVSPGNGAFDAPLGAAVSAYAGGNTPTQPVAGTTRSALAGTEVASTQGVQAHDTDTPGNPYMPPVAPYQSQAHTSSPAAAEDDAPKEPWQPEGRPVREQDFSLDDRDNRPENTWAPNANRSREFAALDNMKLTTPEEALAQWRSQQEAAQSAPQPTASVAPPPSASLAPPLQAASFAPPADARQASSTGHPWAAPPAAPAQASISPAVAQPSGGGDPWAMPAQTSISPGVLPQPPGGDPWAMPAGAAQSTPGGFVMPANTPGPQLNAPLGSPGFSSQAAPSVDLSAGGYNNPNIDANAAVSSGVPAVQAHATTWGTPAGSTPGMVPAQGNAYQARYQAMTQGLNPMMMAGLSANPMMPPMGMNPMMAGMNPAAMGGMNPMAMGGMNPMMGGMNPMMGMGMNPMMTGNPMMGGGLFGGAEEGQSENSGYGMFGGGGHQGTGDALMLQMSGSGM